MNNERLRTSTRTTARTLGVSEALARPILTRVLAELVRAELEDEKRRFVHTGPEYESAREERNSRGGSIRIPFLSRTEDGRPLQRAISYTSQCMNVHPDAVALAMTFFLEAIAQEVERGSAVLVPGFGLFGPFLWRSKRTGVEKVQPRFVASRGFRQQVKAAGGAKNDRLLRYQRHHHPSSRRDAPDSRTDSAMMAWRSIIYATTPAPAMLVLGPELVHTV